MDTNGFKNVDINGHELTERGLISIVRFISVLEVASMVHAPVKPAGIPISCTFK